MDRVDATPSARGEGRERLGLQDLICRVLIAECYSWLQGVWLTADSLAQWMVYGCTATKTFTPKATYEPVVPVPFGVFERGILSIEGQVRERNDSNPNPAYLQA